MRTTTLFATAFVALCLPNVGCTSNSSSGSSSTATGGAASTAGSGGQTGDAHGANPYPFVYAGGIGVTDLEGASKFLTTVMGMTQEGSDVTRDDRVERTFFAKEANRGSRVVLMKFNDGRSTQNIPAKLVFEAPDVQLTYQGAVDAGYTGILPPIDVSTILVSQVTGPDGYTVEILHGLADGGESPTEPFFIALGFGVSDLMASEKFYADGFGMKQTVPYSSSDLVEQTMEYPHGGGAGLVLQHYDTSMHDYLNNPVKHVSFVPDVNAFVSQITSAGGTVTQKAAAMPAYGGKLGAVLGDPDGVVIELVQD